MFHRIVKTLNEYYDDYNDFDVKRYTKYIGTLRTQISPAEFQVILFNSLYIKRGFGLGIQLIGSGFLEMILILKLINILKQVSMNSGFYHYQLLTVITL